jgi:hypothetical protein
MESTFTRTYDNGRRFWKPEKNELRSRFLVSYMIVLWMIPRELFCFLEDDCWCQCRPDVESPLESKRRPRTAPILKIGTHTRRFLFVELFLGKVIILFFVAFRENTSVWHQEVPGILGRALFQDYNQTTIFSQTRWPGPTLPNADFLIGQ